MSTLTCSWSRKEEPVQEKNEVQQLLESKMKKQEEDDIDRLKEIEEARRIEREKEDEELRKLKEKQVCHWAIRHTDT